MIGSESLWVASIMFLGMGSIVSLLLCRKAHLANACGHTALVLGSLCSFVFALQTLVTGDQVHTIQTLWLPYSGLELRVDGIGAFFMTIISLLSGLVGVYGFGYAREYYGRHSIGWLTALTNVFVLSMLLVISANNSLTFLVAWELMSLSSYFLVVYEQKGGITTRAGFIYIVMTHIGTAAIMVLFLILFSITGSFQFESYQNIGALFSSNMSTWLFFLALIGFGTKAGLVPLHIWLPVAHPSAPSHISALMSGVMVKTAIYAFLRIVLTLGMEIPLWWGSILIILGLISAVLGVMYALVEKDIKRLLAYSTVENVGLIFTGIGVLFVFKTLGFAAGVTVASAAVLLHILNHSLFKGLLFLAAGAVVQATHTKDMDKLGGLIRLMPQTAIAFFVGAVSIAALPPLNGFISEWLLFQSMFQLGILGRDTYMGVLAPIGIALLGLVGALVAASVIKVFGAVFLARPRTAGYEHLGEAPGSMRGVMFAIAVSCVLSGVLSPSILHYMNSAIVSLSGNFIGPLITDALLQPFAGRYGNSLSPLGLAVAITLVAAILLAMDRIWGRHTKIRVDETWGCGIDLTPRMEYTGTSFSQPFKIIFRSIFLPERSLKREYVGLPYFARVIRYQSSVTPVIERYMYRPAKQQLLRLMHQLRRIQTGRLQVYLGYIFVTLIALLVFVK
jgi:hydrogenase-4 component B